MVHSEPLPIFMNRENTCCFTGHRNITDQNQQIIIPKLEKKISELHREGYLYFISGGAYGFDMIAAETVIRAKRNGCPINLVLALPCRNQTEKWNHLPDFMDKLRRYLMLKGFADAVCYMYDFYVDGCMRERNLFMIEHSSACIAYCDPKRRGGSSQTVGMAERAGIKVYNIFE